MVRLSTEKSCNPVRAFRLDPGDVISLGKDTKIFVEEIPAGKGFFQKQDATPDLDEFPSHLTSESVGEKRSRSMNQLNLISSVSRFLTNTSELDEFIEKMLKGLIEALPRVDRAAVFLSLEKDGDAEFFAGRSKSNGDYRGLNYDRKLVRRTLKEGKPLFLTGHSNEELDDLSSSKRTAEIKSVACFPIAASGGTYGVLYLDGIKGPHAIRQEDLSVLQTLTNHAAAVLINHQLATYISSGSVPDHPEPAFALMPMEQKEDDTTTYPDISYKRKPAFISFLPTYFFCYLASFVLVYSSSDLTRWMNDQVFSLLMSTPPNILLGMGYGMMLSIPFVLFGLRKALWNLMTCYEIDADGVHLFTGILTRKDFHLTFHEFDEVSFNQSLLEAPFKVGTLVLKSRKLGECGMRGVHDVKNLVDQIRQKKRSLNLPRGQDSNIDGPSRPPSSSYLKGHGGSAR